MTTVTDTEYDNLSEHDRAQVKRVVVTNPRLDLIEISKRYGSVDELDMRSWPGRYTPVSFWKRCTGKKLMLSQVRDNCISNRENPYETVVCKWFMCSEHNERSNVENVSCDMLTADLSYVVPLNIKASVIHISHSIEECLREFRQKFDDTFSRCYNVEYAKVTVSSRTKGGDDWRPYLVHENPYFVYELPWTRMAVDNDFDELFE